MVLASLKIQDAQEQFVSYIIFFIFFKKYREKLWEANLYIILYLYEGSFYTYLLNVLVAGYWLMYLIIE